MCNQGTMLQNLFCPQFKFLYLAWVVFVWLGCKSLLLANTLAYYKKFRNCGQKSFITLSPGVIISLKFLINVYTVLNKPE
jgi:hypothetical protein